MISFRERDPAVAGLVGLVVFGLLILVSLDHDRLPIVGTSVSYSAKFPEAAGLRSGDRVTVAGVVVGRVDSVELADSRVRVLFTVRKTWLGEGTTAAIRISTLLGGKYLVLVPAGDRPLDPAHSVPGVSPYDVTAALGGLSSTLGQVDTAQLGRSFAVLAQDFADTPASVRSALTGLAALSDTVTSRDRQLSELLGNTATLSAMLANRDDQIRALVVDGNSLLGMLSQREQAVSALLAGTSRLATQISGLVTDNNAQLGPVLAELDTFSSMLVAHQNDLARSIDLLAPFSRLMTNVVGTGRWVDGYACGLLPQSVGQPGRLQPLDGFDPQ